MIESSRNHEGILASRSWWESDMTLGFEWIHEEHG